MIETRHDTPDQPEHDQGGCLICRRRNSPRVCEGCVIRLDAMLGEIPDLMSGLDLAMIPGQSPGERVGSSKPHSQAPTSIAALSLRTASSAQLAGAYPEGWRPSAAGDVSIPVWVDGWVRAVRLWLGHSRPQPKRHTPRLPLRPSAPEPPADATPAQKAAHAEAMERWRQDKDAELQRQMRTGPARKVIPAPAGSPGHSTDPDALGDDFRARFGADEPRTVVDGVKFLRFWLSALCSGHPDAEAFAAGLKALVNAGRAATGQRPTEEYLGRCPVDVVDRETNETGPCGTPLYQDAYAEEIVCRRCRTNWEKDKGGWLRLGAMIRHVWPNDPRLPGRDVYQEVAG